MTLRGLLPLETLRGHLALGRHLSLRGLLSLEALGRHLALRRHLTLASPVGGAVGVAGGALRDRLHPLAADDHGVQQDILKQMLGL